MKREDALEIARSTSEYRRMDDAKAARIIGTTIDFDKLSRSITSWPLGDEEFLRSMARLALELKDDLPSYDTIISDELSGRLPTLILRKIIDKKRKEQGNTTPLTTFFLLGGGTRSPENQSAIAGFIRKKSKSFGKVLLVTESISSGRSAEEFAELFNKNGIEYDVATVSILKEPETSNYPHSVKSKVRYGIAGRNSTSVTHQPGVVGATKRQGNYPHPSRKGEIIFSKNVVKAREDIAVISEALYPLVK